MQLNNNNKNNTNKIDNNSEEDFGDVIEPKRRSQIMNETSKKLSMKK